MVLGSWEGGGWWSWGWDRLYWPCPPPAFLGEGTLHREMVGPLLVQKEKVPWYEGEQTPPTLSSWPPNAEATSEPLILFWGFVFSLPSPAPCLTVEKFLLAGLALVGSTLVAAALVGALLGLALAAWRLGRRRRGRQRPRQRCPFYAELQSVVGTLGPKELEKGGEVGPDYRSLV